MTIRQLIKELAEMVEQGVPEDSEVIFYDDDDILGYMARIDEVYAEEGKTIMSGDITTYCGDINEIQG